ncbi:RagB/SusD family nutrient uptake outer membrane protein [uncultured Duncaniella sp.]|uniref:RagB/SusD family nutrient uptake outer membrane protein n=1 Tax=uncultured Duncaniella sp. TaxID=2768039 RepID=UPI0025FAFF2A|nr:RagB/SusD family nutrient uptake outer membrane protein [uncultured Duncaniella sp.]
MKLINTLNTYIHIVAVAALGIGLTSCEDFLNRPAEDNYNAGNFYQNDEQCYQGVNYLYNSPWYDFQRGFIKVGEVLSGNMYWGSSPYLTFTINGTDEDLVNMSSSLWAAIGHANTVYKYIGESSGPSEEVKNYTRGECLTWKAMAYFYLVRTFGDVPIIHDNSAEIAAGTYSSKFKVQRADVYEYIIMTLEKALELLPKSAAKGRIDYYCAEALLSKVYLTRSGLGMSGSRNQSDLDMAAKFAKDVIDNSGRKLLPVYSDVFRLQNNESEESLIAWRWSAGRDPWTQQNTLQSDLAPVGFDEFGDCWGGYGGPSVDLQDAFGIDVINTNPANRIDTDTRRKAVMMLPGDHYEYFWTNKGGFDPLRFSYDTENYGKGGPGEWQSPTGAYNVKHLYGNNADHEAATGVSAGNMFNQLATHILRLSDVYLIYAEAMVGNNGSTSNADALAAFNAVRGRAIPGTTPYTSITFDDVWKERRLEFAGEGDRWYDYVRLAYFDTPRAINELVSQRRNSYWNLNALFKYYYENGVWDISKAAESGDSGEAGYDTTTKAPNVTASSFTLPFPTTDIALNKNLLADPIHEDVRELYAY